MDRLTTANIADVVLKHIPEYERPFVVLQETNGLYSKNVLNDLAFFVVAACDREHSPEKFAGPIFESLDDLLRRTLGLVEEMTKSEDDTLVREVAEYFVGELVLSAPTDYYHIKSYAGPTTQEMLNKEEAKHQVWIELMHEQDKKDGVV